LQIDGLDGATYQTQFIATLAGAGSDADRIGKVMATVKGDQPEYQMTGEELYIRAVVTSDQPPDDPSFKDQKQQAWTQPVGWERN